MCVSASQVGGLDSTGGARGAACAVRAVKKLAGAGATAEEVEWARAASTRIHAAECEGRWWTAVREARGHLRARARELLDQLAASSHSSVVVMAHSLFLRELFAAALHPSFHRSRPELAAQLAERKLPNCAVASCVLELGAARPTIVDARCWNPPPLVGAREPARRRLFAVCNARFASSRRRRVAPEPRESVVAGAVYRAR